MTEARIDAVTDGRSVLLMVSGEIDMANAPSVEAEIAGAISNQVRVVTIDLGEVGYLDSAGLRILFGLATRLPILQIDLEVVAPVGSSARRVIDLSGLPRVAVVTPDNGATPPTRPPETPDDA